MLAIRSSLASFNKACSGASACRALRSRVKSRGRAVHKASRAITRSISPISFNESCNSPYNCTSKIALMAFKRELSSFLLRTGV